MEKRHGFTDKAIAVGEFIIPLVTTFFFLFLKVGYFQTIIIMIKLSHTANMISFMGKIKITPMRNNLKK